MTAFKDWTTQPQKVLPSSAGGTTITPNGSSFVNSNWAQITSGISRDIIVTGFSCPITEAGLWRWDIGIGGIGAEVVAGTWGENIETTSTGFQFWEIKPALSIAANTAISARLRKSGTSVTTVAFKLWYYQLDPLGAVSFNMTINFAIGASVAHPNNEPVSLVRGPRPIRGTRYLKRRF